MGKNSEKRMRFAYADPPYIGQAKARYKDEPTYGGEVDHAELIKRMDAEYDAWALSCSSPTLQQILALCPSGVRIGAWVKPFCAFKPNVGQAFAWEPVIFHRIRKRTRQQETERDWVAENITLRKGLCGVKPLGFSNWLFSFVNLNSQDEFIDLFPGSGAVTAAWQMFCQPQTLKGGQLLKETATSFITETEQVTDNVGL